jgi:hypothetical protein
MTPAEMKIMQLEAIVKQKDTEITRLNRIIDQGTFVPDSDPEETDVPEPAPKPEKAKRKAPTKPCTVCGTEVYAMCHKRHEAKCSEEDPSTLGIVK